ncbi:MAG: PASTA domain-containing protein [Myxococcales bacterium]|nr:PASTA domain-containing protein [Myxococcales bacterium]
MSNDSSANALDTMAAPLGELIAAVGRGMADAQRSLDAATIETIQALARADPSSKNGEERGLTMLRQMGYQPTWYRIPELDAEITASLSVSKAESVSATSPLRLYLSPVDASYSNRYDYNLEAATVIRFKVVPVPPTPQAAEMKVVPPIVGLSASKAGERLAELGIPFEATGAISPGNTVEATSPEPGKLIGPGQTLKMTLASS